MIKSVEYIGKRAITHATDKYLLGVIESYNEKENEQYDEIVCVGRSIWGHRKYFFIEGIDKEFDEIIKTFT